MVAMVRKKIYFSFQIYVYFVLVKRKSKRDIFISSGAVEKVMCILKKLFELEEHYYKPVRVIVLMATAMKG